MHVDRYAMLAAALAAVGFGANETAAGDDRDPPPPAPMTVTASPARGPARRLPPAGAAYYLHYGSTGLCVIGDGFDWSQVPEGGMTLFEPSRVLAIDGSNDAETLVDIQPVDQGTSTPWDDELRVTVTVLAALAGPDPVTEEVFPLWDTDGGADLGDEAIENTPQSLFLKRIEFHGAIDDVATALYNGSRVPMHATGWFSTISSGESGFNGGGGPDCVEGSLLNDIIATGAGEDWVTTKDGNDVVSAGDGNDTVQSGFGNDELAGGFGIDHLQGGSHDDCHNGGQDGQRDLLDDVGTFDFDRYRREAGVVDGEEVDNIEILTDVGEQLVEDCL